ncbi:polysaccharide pyruvyl transferase CsaB [Nodosilinea sp. P-1105]|uniref:polysaccharide pyruvyl transferase CsaB n=1 Tax=Nodosilinea sp. P-1105 TaxID=2546229 RepID=UPI00146D6D06|nr:polysaccharide pyruvyl transferase CsaB [Nodosilinea sp. P-1105]NMF85513.1 polysaccharide pyruvyl transferase CsaB [Nodosilinea sp. P-1105]
MRAVLCGYYGMGNGGDEALLATLLQMLPTGVTPVVLSGNPVETAQRYGVEAVPRKHLRAVIGALRGADALIWGGGSLLQDATSLQNPLYYSGLMVLAQWLGLKTVAWAQGIGPLNHQVSQWLGHYALSHCDGVSVRDSGSAAWLARWQVPGIQAPDPVWALAAAPVEGLWELPAPRVAVALRPHPWLTESRLDQITQALGAFQTATDTCLLLVPFQPVKDLPIAEYIQPRLPGPSHIYTLRDPSQLKGLFRGVEMTIGMRFHALIMAAAEGCRCFGLSYDPKVSYLMTDLDLPGFDLNPQALSADLSRRWPQSVDHMAKVWMDTYANGDPVSPDQIQSRYDRALMHQDLLRSLLAVQPQG